MTDRCHNCDRPLATQHDADTIPEDEGEHLCWGGCEPIDWRARCLAAERVVEAARSQVCELNGIKYGNQRLWDALQAYDAEVGR